MSSTTSTNGGELMISRRAFAAAALAGTLVLSACSQKYPANPSNAAAARGGSEFVRIIQTSSIPDFTPYDSPSAMMADAAVAVHGRVASVEDGRLYSTGVPQFNIMIGIEVDDVLRDDPERKGELIYIELNRPREISVKQYAESLPIGTEAALFAYRWDDPGFRVAKPNAGREQGASVYAPLVQGFWLSDGTRLTSALTTQYVSEGGWAGIDSWEELKAAAQPG